MTRIINIFGGPGVGKSTTRAGVFYQMKVQGFNVEEVTEIAKDFVWEERKLTLASQPYIFGKQLRNLERLHGKVEYVVTDSPILLSALYIQPDQYPESFTDFMVDQFKRMDNLNFLIIRNDDFTYNPIGRNQDAEGAKINDDQMDHFLFKYDIPVLPVVSGPRVVETILGVINQFKDHNV